MNAHHGRRPIAPYRAKRYFAAMGSSSVHRVVLLFIPLSFTVAWQEQRSSAEDDLIRIEQTLARAWPERDRVSIEKILAPEWSVTDFSGRVLSRDIVLHEAFEKGSRVVESARVDDLRVRLYGATAVVTGRTTASGRLDGKPVATQLRFTDVFVQTPTGWKAVASHASEIRNDH